MRELTQLEMDVVGGGLESYGTCLYDNSAWLGDYGGLATNSGQIINKADLPVGTCLAADPVASHLKPVDGPTVTITVDMPQTANCAVVSVAVGVLAGAITENPFVVRYVAQASNTVCNALSGTMTFNVD